jgi:hypothetical protein
LAGEPPLLQHGDVVWLRAQSGKLLRLAGAADEQPASEQPQPAALEATGSGVEEAQRWELLVV